MGHEYAGAPAGRRHSSGSALQCGDRTLDSDSRDQEREKGKQADTHRRGNEWLFGRGMLNVTDRSKSTGNLWVRVCVSGVRPFGCVSELLRTMKVLLY